MGVRLEKIEDWKEREPLSHEKICKPIRRVFRYTGGHSQGGGNGTTLSFDVLLIPALTRPKFLSSPTSCAGPWTAVAVVNNVDTGHTDDSPRIYLPEMLQHAAAGTGETPEAAFLKLADNLRRVAEAIEKPFSSTEEHPPHQFPAQPGQRKKRSKKKRTESSNDGE